MINLRAVFSVLSGLLVRRVARVWIAHNRPGSDRKRTRAEKQFFFGDSTECCTNGLVLTFQRVVQRAFVFSIRPKTWSVIATG